MKRILFLLGWVILSIQAIEKSYVVNTTDHSVSVVSEGVISNTILVGKEPFNIAFSKGGERAYVVNTASHNVSVIDTVEEAIVNTIPVGNTPQGIAFSKDGKRAYVVNAASHNVSIIDTIQEIVVNTIPVGLSPFAISFSRNGQKAYVTNSGEDSVSVIDVFSETVTSTIPVGGFPRGVAFSRNGKRAYVVNGADNCVSIIDAEQGMLINTIPIGLGPVHIAFSRDGQKAYVTNSGEDSVSVIDVFFETVTSVIPVGNTPQGISFSPDGNRIYVANLFDNNLSVINAASERVIKTLSVGAKPMSVAFAPLKTNEKGIQGKCQENIFFSQKELFNEIFWPAVEQAEYYSIYRDGSFSIFLGKVYSNQFIDRCRTPGKIYEYFVTATVSGIESLVGSATVKTTMSLGEELESAELEAAPQKKFNYLSLSRQESIQLFTKAEKYLRGYKGFKPENEVRNLIHKTGIPTFLRPKGIPENYRIKLSRSGAGMKYVHPKDEGTYIRVMPGKSHSNNPCQQKPYVNRRIKGQSVDKFGKKVSNDSVEAHIPLEEFIYREF